MNMNQIINMVLRIFMRKAINKGVNAGINMAARRKGGSAPDTPEERKQLQANRQNGKRAGQAMRVVRRIGRF